MSTETGRAPLGAPFESLITTNKKTGPRLHLNPKAAQSRVCGFAVNSRALQARKGPFGPKPAPSDLKCPLGRGGGGRVVGGPAFRWLPRGGARCALRAARKALTAIWPSWQAVCARSSWRARAGSGARSADGTTVAAKLRTTAPPRPVGSSPVNVLVGRFRPFWASRGVGTVIFELGMLSTV